MYSNNRNIVVREIMSSPVVTGSLKEGVKDIAKKMKQHDVDSIVIVNQANEPVGIITEGDMVRRLLARTRNLLFFKAKDIISKPVLSVRGDMSMDDAAQTMMSKRVKKLCVVDEQGKLIGLVTQFDIIKNSTALIGVLREMVQAGYAEETETA